MSESTSSREENVGEVVYSRSAGIGDQADDWDDSSLIEAYDAALGGILDKLDKRQRGPSEQKPSSGPGSSSAQTKWKRGDFCKAQYTVDEQWYEAKILAIDRGYCIVEYLGYLNHERQPLKALKASGGQKQRQLQTKSAEMEEAGEPADGLCEEGQLGDNAAADQQQSTLTKSEAQSQQQRQKQQLEHLLHLQEQHRRGVPDDGHQKNPQGEPARAKQTKDSARKRGANESSMPSMIAFPPPPPPFPPGVDEICASDEALAAMLISWYISGYHTGYYTAVRNNTGR